MFSARYARDMNFLIYTTPAVEPASGPDPTVTFWLAIGAIVVSVVSAVAALIAVRQTWLYHPRPHWKVTFTRSLAGSQMEPRPSLNLHIEQLGPGDASAVEFRVKSPGRGWLTMENMGGQIKAMSSWILPISLVTGDAASTLDESTLEYVGAAGEAVTGKYVIQILWRQSPRTSKLKSKKFRHRVS